MRLFLLPMVSRDRRSNFLGREFQKVSERIQENSRFSGLGDRRINPLRARGGSRVGALVGPRAPVGEANIAVSKGPNEYKPELAGWR